MDHNTFDHDDSTAMISVADDALCSSYAAEVSQGRTSRGDDIFILAKCASRGSTWRKAYQDLKQVCPVVVTSRDGDTSLEERRHAEVQEPSYYDKMTIHHMNQLRTWLLQVGGRIGQISMELGDVQHRGHGGSNAPSSTSFRNTMREKVQQGLSIPTIQERRKSVRRKRSADLSHLAPIDAGSSNSNFAQLSSHSSSESHASVKDEQMLGTNSHTVLDPVDVLINVANRPNPVIDIGDVDLSCSFTVSDAMQPDHPIIYCSESFSRLTGYACTEIVGRNCRFLQAPDGNTKAGTERFYTDQNAVWHLKTALVRLKECQTCLINYRRDGSPFLNLFTVVPITWDDFGIPVIFVSFHVDVIRQPSAVIERQPNGIYVVNYKEHNDEIALPQYTYPSSGKRRSRTVTANRSSRNAIHDNDILEAYATGRKETTNWSRVLLENSHDIIHVLSLQGTFLYVSPAAERLLGYRPEEMVGKNIRAFCHPSDIASVFRGLKESTGNASIAAAAAYWAHYDGTVNPPTKGGAGQTGPQVNLMMRMKHKIHGHVWIDHVGKLHLEQGKGRKVIISSGRLRRIYNLPWKQAQRSLDRRKAGLWFKIATTGLILGTSGTLSDLAGGPPSTKKPSVPFIGKHIRNLVNQEAFHALLAALNSEHVTTVPHMLFNALGDTAQMVSSTVIPSSADEQGLKAVFVYTQRASPTECVVLQQDASYFQSDRVAARYASRAPTLRKEETAAGSIFAELSINHSGSWIYELQQLKNAKKRLRERVRAHWRQVSRIHDANHSQLYV